MTLKLYQVSSFPSPWYWLPWNSGFHSSWGLCMLRGSPADVEVTMAHRCIHWIRCLRSGSSNPYGSNSDNKSSLLLLVLPPQLFPFEASDGPKYDSNSIGSPIFSGKSWNTQTNTECRPYIRQMSISDLDFKLISIMLSRYDANFGMFDQRMQN